jgi:cytochrome c oxidase subunit I+III
LLEPTRKAGGSHAAFPPTGWRYWSAVNNSEVGVWYTARHLLFFLLFGGVLALLMRMQLAVPKRSSPPIVQPGVHRARLGDDVPVRDPVFEAIAVMFLPQMLGARDLPFPRLSAFGFWCFLLGGLFSAARSSSTPRRAAAGSCIRR